MAILYSDEYCPEQKYGITPECFQVLWKAALNPQTQEDLFLDQWTAALADKGDMDAIHLGRLVWEAARTPVQDMCVKANISQRELATRLCISTRTVEGWCMRTANGRQIPGHTRLHIARVLGLLDTKREG